MADRTRLVTDNPKASGYLHGYQGQPRREVQGDQQSQYESGYRKGAKDSAKDSQIKQAV